MDRCGKLRAAEELPGGRARIDEDQVARGKRVAVRLVDVDAPHPDSQEDSGLFAKRCRRRCVRVDDVANLVRHLFLQILGLGA
jgi:hypothetical protein